ncbi:MAG: hypothetical protein R3Y21_02770 [Mycoplasmatota bacterium]
MKNLFDTVNFTKEELEDIITLGVHLTKARDEGKNLNTLKNKEVKILSNGINSIDELAFNTAVSKLGGRTQTIMFNEFIKVAKVNDMASIFNQIADTLVLDIDYSSSEIINSKSSIPIINLKSEFNYPTQEIVDLITIFENKPKGKKFEDLKIVYMGNCNETAISLMNAVTKFGGHFFQYAPVESFITQNYVDMANENCKLSNGSITMTDVELDAIKEADFIYTSSWGMDNQILDIYPQFVVGMDKMINANATVKVMHPLPIGEEINSEVLESSYSIISEQLKNKIIAYQAILIYVTNNVEQFYNEIFN